jgi:hypothetical protein
MLRAGAMLRRAMRDGIVRPWPVCAVPACNQRVVMGHHASYDPFFWLQVTWLCRFHHARLHAEHRARMLRE